MSSTALKIAAVTLVLVAAVLAIVGYRMSRQFAETAEQAAQQVQAAAPQTMAVVALKPLAAYKPIAKEAVALVPVAVPPTEFYTNLQDVIGKTPLVDVDAGAPITQRYFREGNALARVVPPGFKALSIEINEVVAVGGFVRPGDVVDVLVFLRGGGGIGEAQARLLLREARVLAYEDRIIDRPEGLKEGEGGGDARRRLRTVVLAVPQAETTRVMLGASMGEVRLALHGQALPQELAAGQAPPSAPATAPEVVTIGELAKARPPPGAARRNRPRRAPRSRSTAATRRRRSTNKADDMTTRHTRTRMRP
ncbi:MAG: Flp pilus assembly protein CpaB [Gammaproteobacteria bacterium]|nr:Flp pilus assembly protein CpaB [Gammaproteobacteria bacterium]